MTSSEWKKCVVNWLCCRHNPPTTTHHPAQSNAAAHQNPPTTTHHPAQSCNAAAHQNPPVPENKQPTTQSTTPSESNAAANQNPTLLGKKEATTSSQSSAATDQIKMPVFEEEETTYEDLDNLLAYIREQLGHLLERAGHSSKIYFLASQWVNYKEQTKTFMQTLPTSITNEVAETGKTLLLPLLKQTLGGLGGVHWMAAGFSFIAWALETMDTTAQNWKDCLGLLRRIVSLLESTGKIWQASSKDDDLKVLQHSVEIACQCAIICRSMMQGDGFMYNLLRFLKASTIKDSIANLEKDLAEASEQNRTHMEVVRFVEAPRLQRQFTYMPSDGIVGGDEVKQQAMTYLNMNGSQLMAVFLQGMGGIGKSTLGLDIFSEFQRKKNPQGASQYRCCSVDLPLEIKEEGLWKIQKQILDKLCRHGTPEISSLKDGVKLLKEELGKIREPIFLYLDNVLGPIPENWLPEALFFPKGSRILVTTRNQRVCTDLAVGRLKMKKEDYEHIEVKKLDKQQAKELLWRQLQQVDLVECSWVAEMEAEVLKLCDGLPLALTVVGSHIAHSKEGPSVPKVWKGTIEAMKTAVSLDGGAEDLLYSRLRVSIDLLDVEIKKAFLDIVAYAVGWPWSSAERLVSPRQLEVLCERSLVEKRSWEYEAQQFYNIGVHDVLKALGLRMVKADQEEIRIIGQAQFDETSALEKVVGLMDVTVEAERLQQMPRLRVLQSVEIEGDCQQAAKLRHLSAVRDMRSVTATPFDVSACTALKELEWDRAAANVGDLGVLEGMVSQQLEMLTITGWEGLRDVGAIICLRSLKELTIFFCGSLQSLPEGVASWTGLTSLHLSGCRGLQSLPEGVASWTGLTSLHLTGCRGLQSLPEGVASWTGLTSLDLSWCRGLQSLPEGVASWTGLTSLRLSGCRGLQSLPEGVASWMGLTSLCCFVEGVGLQSLPEGVASWTGLTSLDLGRCGDLQSLPEGVASWTGLTSLRLGECARLQSLPEGVASWTGLTSLDLSGCRGLQSLPEGVASWTGLTSLDLSGCRGLQSLPEGVASWTGLTSLDLSGCRGLQLLPEGVASWTGLTSLRLGECAGLQSLPEGVASWTGLTSLRLGECAGLQSLPEGVASWTGLTSLDLSECGGLQSLPEGVASWTGLKSMDLSECGGLQSLPEGVASWTGLTSLDLTWCWGLQSLPRSVTSLTGLEELRLEGCCGIQALPDGIFGQLTRLRVLGLDSCWLPGRTLVRPQLKAASDSSRSRSPIFLGAAAAHKIGQQRLYFTRLFSLPQEISKLPTLRDLSLQFCGDEDVEFLPSQIHRLTGLSHLTLAFRGSSRRLPDDIVHCTSLTHLELWEWRGETLPSGLSRLQGLRID